MQLGRIRRRFLPALAAGVFIAAQLAAGAHDALVRHAVCADHGETVHVSADGTAAIPSEGIDAIGSARNGAGDDHEHCSLAAERRAPSRPAHALLLRASPPARAVSSRSHAVHSPIAVLRYAPKCSPPAA